MPRKSIQSIRKPAASEPKSIGSEIRTLVDAVQQDLQVGRYEQALDGASNLTAALESDTENQSIYLTSLVWQIRAHQGLKHERDVILEAAKRYGEEAARLGDVARVVQAYRIVAQVYIDAGSWTTACAQLESALNVAVEYKMGRETLEILMHLSAIELKLCHYCEAIDYLSRAMNAIKGAASRDDMRELAAVGQRQLCELYDTIGDGENACDALEAAQNAHTEDTEELWMQQLLLSRFDMRSGDADSACTRLKKIESEVRKAVGQGRAREEQLDMIALEYAQALWNHGEYEAAQKKLDGVANAQAPVRKAVALTRFQWAVEAGNPGFEPDEMSRIFSETCNETEETDIQILLAAALTQAALEIERGHYDATFESLLHIAQTAAFTQLIPFATRALVLRGEIHDRQGNYAQAAEDGKDACETFVAHVDDVSSRQAAALMIRAQFEASQSWEPDEAERAALAQLLEDLGRYERHHHEAAFIDLGLSLADLMHKTGDDETAKEILDRLEKHIIPEFMAHRAMTYYRLKGDICGDDAARVMAAEIAALNDFH